MKKIILILVILTVIINCTKANTKIKGATVKVYTLDGKLINQYENARVKKFDRKLILFDENNKKIMIENAIAISEEE